MNMHLRKIILISSLFASCSEDGNLSQSAGQKKGTVVATEEAPQEVQNDADTLPELDNEADKVVIEEVVPERPEEVVKEDTQPEETPEEVTEEVEPEVTVFKEIKESIQTQTVQNPIDIVWVIDNSGSMSQEISFVESNFSSFLDSISQLSSVKLGLISEKVSSTHPYGIRLSTEQQKQIDLWVTDPIDRNRKLSAQSSNALALIASTACDASLTDNVNGVICGRNIIDDAQNHPSKLPNIESKFRVMRAAGSMNEFFRNDSKKIFVVVSDDSPMGFYTESYVNAMNRRFGTGNHRFFSFSFTQNSVASSTCQQGAVGKDVFAYQDLAAYTKGGTYDICDTDGWADNFKNLTDSINGIATQEFETEIQCEQNVKVTVDGVELGEEQFEFTLPNKLKMTDGVLSATEQIINVSCEIEEKAE